MPKEANTYFSRETFSFLNALLVISREVSFFGLRNCQEMKASLDAAIADVLVIVTKSGSESNTKLFQYHYHTVSSLKCL